jgi:sulfur-oxidizing protein SoxZ
MATRALLHVPKTVRRGDIIEVRATVAHAMETGYRRDGDGRMLARDIVRRIECRYDGELVFAVDCHPAMAANPYIAFPLLVTAGGTLQIGWRGDNGFAHDESVAISVT